MAAVSQLLSPPSPPSAPMFRPPEANGALQGELDDAQLPDANKSSPVDSGLFSAHDMPRRGDPRIVVIIHNPSRKDIVSAFAEVLGRSFSSKTSLGDVTSQDGDTVIGITGEDARAGLRSRNTNLIVTINAHCTDLGMPPDPQLSSQCDFEFLYNDLQLLRKDLARFTSFVLGQASQHEQLMTKPRTYFISTTFPDVRAALPNIDILTVGCDAVEIRVDLLHEPLPNGGTADIPSLSYVGEQVMLLRQRTELPIIFTTRSTDFSNGRFPMNEPNIYFEYLYRAIQWGLEYVDVELWLPEDLRRSLFEKRGQSRIMSAYHDFSGNFRWPSTHAEDIFRRSMHYADIIKMIVIVSDQNANFELEYFRSKMRAECPDAPPFSAVNMGETGQLSRTLNRVFTPVTHPLLPIVAAPGQMSTAQINESLATLGHLPKRNIYGISGLPHKSPRSQASFYEKCLNELGLPHQFVAIQRQSRIRPGSFDFWCNSKDFGGACLDPGCTLPSLLDACPVLSGLDNGNGPILSEAVQAIGMVDTIIVRPSPSSNVASAPGSMPSSPRRRQDDQGWETRKEGLPPNTIVVFDNVSWRGILRTLTRELAPSAYSGRSGILLASSHYDAAPGLLAMKAIGITRTFTVGFKTPDALARVAPLIVPVVSLESLQRARSVDGENAPFLIVSALGSEKSNLVAMVVRAFGASQERPKSQRVFLDLADHRESNSNGLRVAAEQSGFTAYGAADVAAFTTVESLRLLVGQNVPYSFVRLANGTTSLGRGW